MPNSTSSTAIIEKKRDNKELTPDEISNFILGVAEGSVPDYQASAFAMAVFFNGMTPKETVALTDAMLRSGERYDLSRVPGFKVDKHSTGGVGDKVSLILAPLAAACGLSVPMMAGRGLGHSGGTLDKLEAISGFDIEVPKESFERILTDVGCAIIGQSQKMVPADKKLYALRDVTGTVECTPLIVGSILSKKLAEGTQALVLDVKVGSGAFMKTLPQARNLAATLVQVGKKMNLPCRAIITDMNQPLGYAVGNSLEVQECIEVLKNEKNKDLTSIDLKELTIQLCAHMLCVSKKVKNLAEGRRLAQARLADGSAWQVFQKMVKAQKGNIEQILQPEKLPLAPIRTQWKAKKKGFISKMNTEAIGRILVDLGGGRKKASDRINPGVGLIFHKKLGAKVQVGDPLATVYSESKQGLEKLEGNFHQALEISSSRKPVPQLIVERYS